MVAPTNPEHWQQMEALYHGVVARIGIKVGYSETESRKAAPSMPNKHNASRRHHIPKMKFRVKNWAEYDAGLRRRGGLTLWLTPEVLDGWNAARRTTPGGQSSYSELAIETGMMLRLAFHLALRQTEGLMTSIFGLMGVLLSAPDHSTLSRRARKMESICKGSILPDGPIHLLIDSTGLKVFGAGEWLQEKHGARARRTWKKLHLAVNADTGMVMALTLTGNDVGDPSQVAPLLDQIDATIASVTADGAYDGMPTYEVVDARGEDIRVIIPPHLTTLRYTRINSMPADIRASASFSSSWSSVITV